MSHTPSVRRILPPGATLPAVDRRGSGRRSPRSGSEVGIPARSGRASMSLVGNTGAVPRLVKMVVFTGNNLGIRATTRCTLTFANLAEVGGGYEADTRRDPRPGQPARRLRRAAAAGSLPGRHPAPGRRAHVRRPRPG